MKKSLIGILVVLFVCLNAQATVYFSQNKPSQSFADVTNWNTATNGSGANPVLADLTSGLHTFSVQDAHIVNIDMNINVSALIINKAGARVEINSPAKAITIVSSLYVDAGGTFRPSTVAATHTVNISGASATITNLGVLSFYRSATSVANVTISGASLPSISGTSRIDFNQFAINNGGTVNSSGTLRFYDNVSLSNNSTLKGSANFETYKATTVALGSKITTTNGYYYLNGTVDQTLTCNGSCSLYRLTLDNGPGAAGVKTIIGKVSVDQEMRIYSDAVYSGVDSLVVLSGLRIDNPTGWIGSGVLVFGPTTGNGSINTVGNTVQLGSSKLVFQGGVNLPDNSTALILNNDLVVKSNLVLNTTNTITQLNPSSNSFSMESGSRMWCRGFDNFPGGFNTYSIHPNTRVDYDRQIPFQQIKGGITYGDLFLRYNSKLANGPIDVNGNLILRDANLLLTDAGENLNIAGNITGQNGEPSNIDCSNTVTLDGVDANQTLSVINTYTFGDFVIDNVGPITAVRTKNIDANITVNGNFSAVNSGGDAANILMIDIDANSLNGAGGSFTLGANVQLRTSGATAFDDMFDASMPSFSTVSLNAASKIEFDRNGLQEIPGITYGNIEIDGDGIKNVTGNMTILGSMDGDRDNPVFTDNGHTITLYGNWDFGSFDYGLPRTNMTGNFIFNGGTQYSKSSRFNNVTFSGTGTKSLIYTIDAACGFTINDGVTVTSIYDIYVGCDLTVNGTGKLLHTGQELFLDGTTGNQNITIATPSTTKVFNLELMNSSGSIVLNSDLHVSGVVDFQNGTAVTLNISDDTLYVGGDFTMYGEDNLVTTNGTLVFDGNADQTIRNGNASTVYNNLYFRIGGEKNFTSNTFDINGNVIADAGLTLDQNGQRLNVAGNWTHLGTIAGGTGDRVYFDGVNQTIRGQEFNSVYFSGSGTKTLAASTSVKGNLFIESGSSLDVSPSNYSITIEGNWNNDLGGVFTARNGKVIFVGANANIYTGGTGIGNTFNNIELTQATSTSTVTIGNGNTPNDDINIDGNLTITKGTFVTGDRDVYLGGSLLVNASNGRFNGSNGNHDLIFDGPATTKTWQPGPSDIYRQVDFDAVGATWLLTKDASISTNENLNVNNGKLDLNHSKLTMNGNNVDVSINGVNSEIEVDSAAVFTLGNGTNSDLLINNGKLSLLGTATSKAVLTSVGTFQFTQTGVNSVLSANHYRINGTLGSGLNIQAGNIDATNNLSNGTFTGGTGTSYITLYDGAFVSDATLKNVTFNESSSGNPTNNLSYTGTSIVTFEDASGNASGPSRENDSPDGGATTGSIRWTYTQGFFWTGLGGDSNWNTAANWSTGAVPTNVSDVILNHDYVVGAYTVNVNTVVSAADAEAKSVTLIQNGTVNIKLDLNGKNLRVNGDVSIGARAEIEQSLATDTVFIAGSFSNTAGILDGGNSVIVFNPISGNHSISTNSATDANRDFNNVVIVGGGYYTLSDISEFEGNLLVKGGTIDIGDINNELQVNKNFIVSDSGLFVHSNGLLRVEGTTGTQIIAPGSNQVYDIIFEGAGLKTLSTNMIVKNDLTIAANSGTVSGGDNILYVNHDWRNLKGNTGFTQTSNGTVVFNGNTTQDIGQATDASTIFNNVILQSSGAKIIGQNLQLNGDLQILMSNPGSVVEIAPNVLVTGNGVGNDLLMQDGILRIESTNGFPTGFEVVDLLGGEVRYESNGIPQNIYGTTYYNLRIRETGGVSTVKTALGDITVENTFYNRDDINTILNMNCFTFTINGNMDIRSGAPGVDWGTACKTTCGTGGTLVIGDAMTTINANITNFHNLVIDNSGVVELRLTNNINVEGNMTLKNASRFDMRQYTVTNTCLSNPNPTVLTVEDGAEIETQVAAGSSALPSGFGMFDLSVTSTVQYQRTGAQSIYTGLGSLVYGNLDLQGSGVKTLDGVLAVDGDFNMDGTTTLADNSNSMSFSGSLIAVTNYTPTLGTQITFDGNNQTIRSDLGSNTINFRDVSFTGTGTKSFGDDEIYNFLGDFKVGSSAIIDWTSSDNDVSFSGDSIIVSGTLNHNGGDNDFRFNKNGVQVVDLGANHDIAHLEIKSNANVQLINHGLNVTGNGGTQNFVDVEVNSTLSLDTMTHFIAQDFFIIRGTLNSTNANLIFNQNGTQVIDAFVANNVTFDGSGDKDMNGIWRMNDITISGSARVDFNGQDTLVVRGNWTSTADLDPEDGVVRFEMTNTTPKTIQTNSETFAQVKFVSIGGNTSTYTMVDDLNIDDTLRIGTGATLTLSGNTLRLGFPEDGGGNDESLVIEAGAELQIDAGASALFDCNGNLDANVDVYGVFSVVGNSSLTANVSRLGGNGEIDIDILSGGTIKAQNYLFSNLVNDGLFVSNGAIIDPLNNFSNGSFSNMQEGQGAVYLQIESDVTSLGSITGITFNHSGPTVGNDFNVRRLRTDGGILTFDNDVLGSLAGYQYENEVAAPGIGNRIVWPLKTITNWIGGNGGVPNDWFLPANWDNGVPDVTKTAIVGIRPFLPIIGSGSADTAKCKQLELNGNGVSLSITDGIDLYVANSIVQGVGNQNTSINVLNSASDIVVGGSWTASTNSTFVNGGAKVVFNSPSGSATIDVGSITFNSIEFNGSSSFNIKGNLDIDGDFSILLGNVNPNTANYFYSVAGNWDGTGGTFNTSINGTVIMDGASQDIVLGSFDKLTIAGTGCDTIKGVMVVNDDFIVNNCVVSSAGSSFDLNGDVIINASGSINDGGNTHTFSGVNWTGTGGYVSNTGTVVFDRTGGTQNMFASKFNNIQFLGTSRIEMEGSVDVTGNVNITNSINSFYTQKWLMTNTSGIGTLTLGSGENIYVDGANNFPTGFSVYAFDQTSNTRYNGTSNQTIKGGISYGNIILSNSNTKTLSGNIIAKGDLNFGTSTLDVSASNYSISVGDNWINNVGGSFIARRGTVTFNGSGNQALNVGDHPSDGIKKFWNVNVANTSATDVVDVNVGDIYIDSNLTVTDGIFTLAGIGNGWHAYIGSSLIASGSGSFATAGTYYLNSTDNANMFLTGNGSNFNDIVINASTNSKFILGSDLTVDGDFSLLSGFIAGNTRTVQLGTDINDAVIISGEYNLDRGVLALGNQTSLSVTTSGKISIIGTTVLPATVTRRYSTGDYNFSVNGNISANNYIFEYMSAQGITINNGATISTVNNFSNGTFTNPAIGGVCLRIENNQKLTNSTRINNVSFPIDPGAGTFNVAKTVALSDTIEFYNATGSLAGETKDNDPNDLIIWTGPIQLIWTGAKSSDWYDVKNWLATSGPVQVPDSTFDVIIPFVTNQPLITVSGANTKTLYIESGAIVTVNTPNDTASDLRVYEELFLEGVLKTQSVNDVVEVRGNWTRLGGGSYLFNLGGKVLLSGEGGTPTINNGTAPFYDLEVRRKGIVQLATDIVVKNDLLITQGSLDVSASSYQITVGGSFTNDAFFKSRQGTVVLNSTGVENVKTGVSTLYNLKVVGAGTFSATSEIRVNNIFEQSAGVFDLVANKFLLGDASGSDLIQIKGGEFKVNAGAKLEMASNSSVFVTSGGKFTLVGNDMTNRAEITNRGGSTKYNFTVSSGGILSARYFTIDNIGVNGVDLQAGGLLDLPNNMSYGVVRNGAAGGAYITFRNSQDLTGNNRIEYLNFANNPGSGAVNVKKTTGTGEVLFYFAIGNFQGEDFESDVNDLVHWDANMIWTGVSNAQWNNSLNWQSGLVIPITGLIPTEYTDVIIPDASTTPNDPILNVDGSTDDLEIQANGLLTIASNNSLTIGDSLYLNGVLTVTPTSVSTINLSGSWIGNTGIFNSGNNSKVIFLTETGTQTILTNSSFCGLRVNSLGEGDAVIETGGVLDVNCDLVIVKGTFRVADPSHTINLSGNWENRSLIAGSGFEEGTGTVVFDGALNQSLTHDGGSETFYNLSIQTSGGAELNSNDDLVVLNDLIIGVSGAFDPQDNLVSISGDWVNNRTTASAGFMEGTGTVRFVGTTPQAILHSGGNETFYNLTVNNASAGNAIVLNNDVIVVNDFTQTDGIVQTGSNTLVLSNSNASSYTGWNNSNFINGNIRRQITSNTSTYAFPVGKGDLSSDYFLIELINNNLIGTSSITGSVSSIVESGNNVDTRVAAVEGPASGDVKYVGVAAETALWTLSPNVQPTGGSYGVNAYVTNFSGLSDDLFSVLKRPEGSTDYADWDDVSPSVIPGDGATGRVLASGYAARTGWTSFSEFSIGISNQPLPIELLSFDVKPTRSAVSVTWSTVSEKNNSYFTIERSTDGVNFETISIVSSKAKGGNSNTVIDYSYVDLHPLTGTSYYRLKQTDIDSKEAVFEIKAVTFTKSALVNIYPTPVVNTLNVEASGLGDSNSTIELYSILGELLIKKSIHSDQLRLDVSKLPSGMYTVVVSNGNFNHTQVIVINK